MPIFIHVGTQKTGTTSLQKFAAEHRKELRERGLWYPSYREMGLFGHYAHHDFAHALADQGKRLDLGQARAFADFVRTKRRSGESVLISAEPFYRHVLPAPGENMGGDDYWNARTRYIRRMRELFPGADVEIVFCVRRQDAFARSCYQEYVRATRHDQGFEEFLERARHLFQYRKNIELFAEVFPRVAVLVFERLIAEGDLTGRFFARLGVDVGGLAIPGIANPALPCELIEFKRFMNGTALDDEMLKTLARLLPDVATAHRGQFGVRYDWAPAERMSAFQRTFDADNQAIARDYLSEESVPLFPATTSSLPVFPGLDARRLADVSALVFGALAAAAAAEPREGKTKQR